MQCRSLRPILRYPSSSLSCRRVPRGGRRAGLAIAAGLAALIAALTVTAVPIARATAATVVGTWSAPDLGAGGHGGGVLLSDQSVGGSGRVVFDEATEVADFAGGHWQLATDSKPGARRVDLCLFVVPVSDPLGFFGHGPFCFRDVPAEGGQPTRTLTASGFLVQIGVRLLPPGVHGVAP